MERNAHESTAKPENTQKEYAELKEQTQGFDEDELQNLRYDIRNDIESETISELRKIYGGSFIQSVYETAKSETDKSIGETDKYSVRKRLENYKTQKSVQKTENVHSKHNKENER